VLYVEKQIEANLNNPVFVYEALKVYMMLGGLQPPDKDLIKDWMKQDLMKLYPGPNNVNPIQRLEEHLAAMLELESGVLVPIVFVVSCSDGTTVIDPPAGLFELDRPG
jgi:type VI secretion system protein ImpL